MENKQKLIIGAVIAGVLILGVGIGNAGKGDSSANNDSGSNSQIEPAPTYTDEDYFIAEVRSNSNPYIDGAADSALIDVGHQTCSLLDDGYTVVDIATYLVENGDSTDSDFYSFEGIVIGAAVRNLCPEYIDQIP